MGGTFEVACPLFHPTRGAHDVSSGPRVATAQGAREPPGLPVESMKMYVFKVVIGQDDEGSIIAVALTTLPFGPMLVMDFL